MTGAAWFAIGLAVGLLLGISRASIATGSCAYWLVAAAIVLVGVVAAVRRGS